jgi:hypothetical protein
LALEVEDGVLALCEFKFMITVNQNRVVGNHVGRKTVHVVFTIVVVRICVGRIIVKMQSGKTLSAKS